MRHLKSFSIFESTSTLTPEQEEFLDTYIWRQKWKLNSEGLVDIEVSFFGSSKELKDFHGIKFGKVEEYFDCSHNQLQSLEGAPQKVKRDFLCNFNQIRSLKGAPQEVGENFFCNENQLQSLEGAPQIVGKNFDCSGNQLQSLEGAPQKIKGHFWCHINKIRSLVGAPQEVWGDFECDKNPLRSLEGAPEVIGGKFKCDLFEIPKGQWSLATLAKMYLESDGEKKDLLGTLVSPEALQKKIDVEPEKMSVELNSIVRLPEYQDLVWPKGLKMEVDLLGDLDSVGL